MPPARSCTRLPRGGNPNAQVSHPTCARICHRASTNESPSSFGRPERGVGTSRGNASEGIDVARQMAACRRRSDGDVAVQRSRRWFTIGS